MGGMNRFYLLLGGIAVVGGAAIYVASGRSGDAARAALPVAPGDTMPMPGWVMGSDSAPVEVEEYADFQCPGCRQFAVLTLPDVAERLVRTGKVRWRFRDFPLAQIHPNTMAAHEAAACTGEQGFFWQMHDQLYYQQDKWASARNPARMFRDYAKTAGVDLARYDACVGAHRYQARIIASAREGQARGVSGTPTLVIGGMLMNGLYYDSLKALIEKATPPLKS